MNDSFLTVLTSIEIIGVRAGKIKSPFDIAYILFLF